MTSLFRVGRSTAQTVGSVGRKISTSGAKTQTRGVLRRAKSGNLSGTTQANLGAVGLKTGNAISRAGSAMGSHPEATALAVTGAGSLAAVHYGKKGYRKAKASRIGKSANVSAFGVDHS